MAFGDPKGGTKARFEIATRIAIGLCVALIFGIAWWWRSPIKCMAAILCVTFSFLTPPYLGSSVMIISVLTTGILGSLGALTGAMCFGSYFFDGLPDGQVQQIVALATYGMIAVYWLLIVPPCKTSSLQIGLLVITVAVAVPIYSFQAFEDSLTTGVIVGLKCQSEVNGVMTKIPCNAFLGGLCKKGYEPLLAEPQLFAQSALGEYQGFVSSIPMALCSKPLSTDDFNNAKAAGTNPYAGTPPADHFTSYYNVLDPTSTEYGKVVCLPYSEAQVADITVNAWPQYNNEHDISSMNILNGEQFCVGLQPGTDDVIWGMVKPGSWMLEFLWFHMNMRMAPFLSFLYCALIAGACVFLAMFLPPARFATDRLRTLIRDQLLRLRNERLPAALPAGIGAHDDLLARIDLPSTIPQEPLPPTCSIGPTMGRKRLFAIDEPVFAQMDSIGALTVVEINFLDPGPFVALWPSYRKIIPMMKTFSEQMVMTAYLAELSEMNAVDTLQENLLSAVDRLIFEMAFCMSLRPTAGGSAQFNTELMCLKLEEKTDAVKDAAAAWTTVTDFGDRAEQRILIEGHRLAALQMAGSACAIAEGIMTMMKTHSIPSVSGFFMGIFGLFLPIIAIFTELARFWIGFLSPWRFSWKGDWSWWKDPRFLGLIQFFIGVVICIGTFGFITDFRRFKCLMVNPVFLVPGARLGQWVAVPLATVLLDSWHGTIFRAPARLLTLSLGALAGIPALLILKWAREYGVPQIGDSDEANPHILLWGNAMCIAYLVLLTWLMVYTSVDTTGRLAMYGSFHHQYGYGCFMIAYFATVIATEGIDLVTSATPGQPAPYTVWDYYLIRVIGQCVGIAACMIVTTLIPIRAGAAARKLSSQCLRLLSRALLTGIQNWRGDEIEEAAEEEAHEDLVWCGRGRERVNTFIMEMDGLGRFRSVTGDHFFTFWSGDKGDLPALRTLHSDLAMFINLLLKGCRAPIGPMPPQLDHLAHAVDIWAVACAKRIVYIANGQYTKLQGIQTPSDEALETFDAFKKALPALIDLAEEEIMAQEEYERNERSDYDIDEDYENAKRSQLAKDYENAKRSQLSNETPYPMGELATLSKAEHDSRPDYPVNKNFSDGSLMGAYHLAETCLEADQRWQLLIANMVALECAIFSSLPDEADLEPVPYDDDDLDKRYGYGYDDSEDGSAVGSNVGLTANKSKEEPKSKKSNASENDDEDYTYFQGKGSKARPAETRSAARDRSTSKESKFPARRPDVAIASGDKIVKQSSDRGDESSNRVSELTDHRRKPKSQASSSGGYNAAHQGIPRGSSPKLH